MGTNAVGDSILETDIEGWLRFKIVNAEMVAIPGEENKVVCFILQDSNFHFQFSNYLFNFTSSLLDMGYNLHNNSVYPKWVACFL